MSELKDGTIVDLTIGERIKVIKELGRGGQGIVYLVDLKGKKFALKWYLKDPSEKFYQNLENNIKKGAPTKAFLWPLMLTRRQYDSCGYIMNLRPEGYYEFGLFLLARHKFKSYTALLTAALNICDGFEKLHRAGYSYQDMNDGNFFINPENGDVLICDNDNVVPQGDNLGIAGKARYMAPEIVAGGKPDIYSDRFSLAVLLFMLFFANHPFDGKNVVSHPCLTESIELKLYSSEAVFILDPTDQKNLPVRGIHQNVITRWPVYPKHLRQAFINAFNKDVLFTHKEQRTMESKWKKTIIKLRNELIVCPCGEDALSDPDSGNITCFNCGKAVQVLSRIRTKEDGEILLTPKKDVYLKETSQPVGKVRINKSDPSVWALQNVSEQAWMVETPSGKLKELPPSEIMPIKVGMKITFEQGYRGEII